RLRARRRALANCRPPPIGASGPIASRREFGHRRPCDTGAMLPFEQQVCEEPEVSTVVELLRAQSSTRADTPALLAPDRRPATYADLWGQVGCVATALRGAGLDH